MAFLLLNQQRQNTEGKDENCLYGLYFRHTEYEDKCVIAECVRLATVQKWDRTLSQEDEMR